MYVCVCNAVTDSDIRNAVEDGVRSIKQLKLTTNIGNTCGSCIDLATEVFLEALTEKRESQDLLSILQPA